MGQRVNLIKIKTDRDLDPGDDISVLTKHINDSGLQVPILVDHNLNLIDGLRRLEAVRSLGHTTIEVNVTSMYPQACMWLKQAREHGTEARPLVPQRIWEIYRQLAPLMNITRSHAQRGRKKGQPPKIGLGGRPALVDALGLPSESPLQAITQVYRAAEEDPTERGDRAREAVVRVNDGSMTIYSAVDHMRMTKGLYGEVVSVHAQRVAFKSLVANLNGLGHGMDQLGQLNPSLTTREIEDWLRSLKTSRRRLATFIHLVEEEIKNRE